MNKLKIAMLSSFYHPHVGGTEKYVEDLSRALAARGHRITVFTHSPGADLPDDGDDSVRVVRLPSLWLPYRPYAAILPTRQLREQDLIHSHAPSFYFTNQASRIRNIPHVLTYHCDLDLPDQYGKFTLSKDAKKVIDRYLHKKSLVYLRKIDRIIATTHSYAESSPVLRQVPYEVIPIGIHRGEFTAAAERIRAETIRRDPEEILYVGRLVASKGLVFLIEAAKLLRERGTAFKLTIAGRGEDSLMLKMMVRNYGLENEVRFLGQVSREELYRLYAGAALFVLPSFVRLEAFGIVQLEALAMGLPVVASDLPGVNEVVRNTQGGWLVPPRKPAELADALAYALANTAEREERGRDGRNYVLEHYDWDRVAVRVEDLYNRLLDSPHRPQ